MIRTYVLLYQQLAEIRSGSARATSHGVHLDGGADMPSNCQQGLRTNGGVA
jgi:hypothetical protein